MAGPIVILHRRGQVYVGDCPHDHAGRVTDDGTAVDGHGNLAFSPTRNVYHCFACGCGGKVPNRVDINDHIVTVWPDVVMIMIHPEAAKISEQGHPMREP